MYNRPCNFLAKKEIILLTPVWFLTEIFYHSCSQSSQYQDKIRNEIVKGNYGIFVDFQKDFDTVDHHMLLKKQEYYGVTGISNKWFASYLGNRKQFV